MRRPYNNPTWKHRRRVSALARLKAPNGAPPETGHIAGAGADARKAKLVAEYAERHAARVARYEREKTALEERIAHGGRR